MKKKEDTQRSQAERECLERLAEAADVSCDDVIAYLHSHFDELVKRIRQDFERDKPPLKRERRITAPLENDAKL